MKYLEYIVCCTGCSSSISEADDSKSVDPVLQPENHHCPNRINCSIKSGSATTDWRPSLKPISEDNIVAAVNTRNTLSTSVTTLNPEVSSLHKSKAPPRRSHDHG